VLLQRFVLFCCLFIATIAYLLFLAVTKTNWPNPAHGQDFFVLKGSNMVIAWKFKRFINSLINIKVFFGNVFAELERQAFLSCDRQLK